MTSYCICKLTKARYQVWTGGVFAGWASKGDGGWVAKVKTGEFSWSPVGEFPTIHEAARAVVARFLGEKP